MAPASGLGCGSVLLDSRNVGQRRPKNFSMRRRLRQACTAPAIAKHVITATKTVSKTCIKLTVSSGIALSHRG
jgi:hypothetical protein